MILTRPQAALRAWLCDRIQLTPTPKMVCIGNINSRGRIVGVVGYDNFNGASIQMHCAGEGNWLTRQYLNVIFDYPFNVCKVNVALILISSENKRSIKLNTHIGFKIISVLTGAHPDGDLLVLAMTRAECRYLDGAYYGQIERSATSTGLRSASEA